MIFDMEKEKARWQMEYDNIVTQKRELEDIIGNLERRKELLFKENDRLKSEARGGAQSKGNRSSVDARGPAGPGSNAAGPKLGLGLGAALNPSTTGPHLGGSGLNNKLQKSSGKEKSAMPQSNLGAPQGQLIGLRSGAKSGLTSNPGGARGSQQNLAPAHPQRYQFQLQQLQFQGGNSQQQMNTRYGNMQNSGNNSATLTESP